MLKDKGSGPGVNFGMIPSKDVGWNICAEVVDKCQFSLHT